MAIIENGKFRRKRQISAKIESSRVWPNTNEMTKRGILANDNFIKMTSLAKIYKSLAKM